MAGVIFAVLFFGALLAAGWLYYYIKEQAKRKLFFRAQYERQKALTHQYLILTTVAPMQDLLSSLAHHIPDDRSTRAAFMGGAMKVHLENPWRIIYQHRSKITTGGDGDAFTASVNFEPIDASRLRAVVSIDRWREKDGVTRRAGINAMENFMNTVVTAFRAVDPAVHIGG